MKQAAQQILKVATTINSKQRAELHFFDNPVVEPKIRRRSSAGAYKIGDAEASTAEEQVVGPLQEKILKLLARKLAMTEFDNRTIVVVITNGSVSILYPHPSSLSGSQLTHVIIFFFPRPMANKPLSWQTRSPSSKKT